jgi:MFS family permease
VTRRQLGPLTLPRFRYLFYATLGSSLGTLLAAVALAIDVKDRTNSGLWVGAVLVVEFLPTILVGLVFGPLLDRLERRSLMIGADLLRAGVFAALPFAQNAATVVGLALVAGLATGFFRPAVYAGVPNIVPEEQLPEANALLQGVENLSWALGPLLGGILTAAAGPSAAYVINAASFVVSILLLVRIPARALQSERALSRGHWRDLKDGFVAVFRSRPLLAVLVAWGVASLGLGATNLAEVFLAKDTFHSGDFGYGLLYSAIGAGLVAGSVLSAGALDRLGVAASYGLGLAVMALGFAGTAASPNVWTAAGFLLVGGIGNGVAVACNAYLVQRSTDDALRGRALTFLMSATYVLVGVGTGVGGAALHTGGARWVWAMASASLALAAVAGFAIARGARMPEPAARELTPASVAAD